MKVLLTTDGEPHSGYGIRALTSVADRGATVEVVSVNTFDIALQMAAGSGPGGHYDRAASHEACRVIVDAAVVELTAAGFSPTGRVLEGDAPTEIIRNASEEGIELIVMGAGSHQWLDAVMLGSTSFSVLHHAPCSVLIGHPPREGTDDRADVLVATDGSVQALRGARAFAGLADPQRCAVRVVAVAHQDWQPDEAAAAVAAAAGVLREAGLAADGAILSGHPGRTLLEEAREHDLVVVGATGAGAFTQALLGSTSDKLARHAHAALIAR